MPTIEELADELAALKARSGADTASQNLVSIDAQGKLSASFSGKTVAFTAQDGVKPTTFQLVELLLTADAAGDIAKVELFTNYHNQPQKTYRLIDNAAPALSDWVLVQGGLITGLFPTPARDGQIVWYQAAVGVTWTFRWNAATSFWDFVGGPPLFAQIPNPSNLNTETTTSLSYTDLATVGPSLTIPLAGDYDITIGHNGGHSTTGFDAMMSYAIGGTAASDNDRSTATGFESVTRDNRKTGLIANTAIVCKYRIANAGTGSYRNRWLRIQPVRCQ